jgi:hypothetical protein
MTATRELAEFLITNGMHPADAAALMARALTEMAPPTVTKSPAAKRQAAYRERNKASQNVTDVTHNETSQIVTNHNETSQSHTSPLSYLLISDNKDHIEKKGKRESPKTSRASQLPDGWKPDETAWQSSISLVGLERCEAELVKFKNYAADKGRVSKSWNAAWRNWIDRAIDYGKSNGTRRKRPLGFFELAAGLSDD